MTVQVSDAGGLAVGGNGENGMNSGCNLKAEPTGSAAGGIRSQGRVTEDNFEVFVLSKRLSPLLTWGRLKWEWVFVVMGGRGLELRPG